MTFRPVFRPMVIADYAALSALFRGISGVRLRDADSTEGIARYLSRKPRHESHRRGERRCRGLFIRRPRPPPWLSQPSGRGAAYRRHGIATRLVNHVLSAIGRGRHRKFHIDLFSDNDEGFATSSAYPSSPQGTEQ